MKKLITLLLLVSFNSWAQQGDVSFEEQITFFPAEDLLNNDNIQWGYFAVPEDWNAPNERKIKLATAILKNFNNSTDTDPIVIIDGGPGSGSIDGIWWWYDHPIRNNRDIILIDARGTGFSSPRLCPDLGNQFFKILAKNQSSAKDEEEKVMAALACKQQLVGNGVNVNAYNSKNIAQDLHAIKEYLRYPNWHVYAVSYGTYVAQVYASMFPNDVKALILDSPISQISEYYTLNTTNYVSSLNRLFATCRNDPKCDAEYPDLEDIYYKVIDDLIKSPITVKVDKSSIEEGVFTYNAEDFKIAIHQALYQKELIEVLPLLIYQFHDRNKDALSALVAAFSSALALDYGMYYCVSCNEALPMNSIEKYQENSNKYPRLNGGLSFYNSDFAVCNKWNATIDTASIAPLQISKLDMPTLIFTGYFDPITPSRNGDSLLLNLKNSSLLAAQDLGHASSYTNHGFELVTKFVNNPVSRLTSKDLPQDSSIDFIKDIYVSGGVSSLGNSISNFDPLFFSPLIIALLILLFAIVIFTISLIRRKDKDWITKILKLLLVVCSIMGIAVLTGLVTALNNTASINYYILAIGLPENWSYLFTLLIAFLGVLIISSLYFMFSLKKIDNRSLIFTVLFSNIVLGGYFLYWGFLTSM